jgi:predicted dehydrogenase
LPPPLSGDPDLASGVEEIRRATRSSDKVVQVGMNHRFEDTGCAPLTCDRGLSVIFDVSWRYLDPAESTWFTMLASRGSAVINPLAVSKEMHGTRVNVTPTGALGHDNEYTASFRAQWAHFAAMVRGFVERPDLDDQITLHRVVDAVFRSAQTSCSIESE